MRGTRSAFLTALALVAYAGCAKKAEFPNQIPAIVATLGQVHSAWTERARVRFDSVCTDRELYDVLTTVFGDDSLAVLGRRIHNPVDSADVVMTVGRFHRDTKTVDEEHHTLELFMRREGDRFWVVAHRLDRSHQ